VLGLGPAQRLEAGGARARLADPLAREAAGLDVRQHAPHGGAYLVGHDLGAARVVAVLRRVADRAAHEAHPAAVHQVDDQFQLV